jgi:hypothetical protein
MVLVLAALQQECLGGFVDGDVAPLVGLGRP